MLIEHRSLCSVKSIEKLGLTRTPVAVCRFGSTIVHWVEVLVAFAPVVYTPADPVHGQTLRIVIAGIRHVCTI